MPKNKLQLRSKKQNRILDFFMPTKWKVLLLIILYFGNYMLSFFGLLLNSPIYYLFYWGRPAPTGIEGMIAFLAHLAYLYLLSCIITKLLT